MSEVKKPVVTITFGVLNLIIYLAWFVLLLLGLEQTLKFRQIMPFLAILTFLMILVTLLGSVSGILLLTGKRSTIMFTYALVISSWLVYLASIGYHFISFGTMLGLEGTIISMIFPVILGLVYPLLVFLLVLKNEAVKIFYGSQD